MSERIALMIAGAHKAGTSSLKSWLSWHGAICTHASREFTYFVNASEYEQGYEAASHRYFGHCPLAQVRLLAKSVGVMYSEVAVSRLKTHNPDVSLVVVLRNPTDRAVSAFHYARRMGLEPEPDFMTAIRRGPDRFGGDWVRAGTCDYLGRGLYGPALQRLFSAFGRDQVTILLLEDLKSRPAAACAATLAPLGLSWDLDVEEWVVRNPGGAARSQLLSKLSGMRRGDLGFVGRIFPRAWYRRGKLLLRKLNRGGGELPPASEQARQFLMDYYRAPNEELARLIDRDLSHWNGRQGEAV